MPDSQTIVSSLKLTQNTFYITESTAFRNRVLYFRQDDWQRITRPLQDSVLASNFASLSEEDIRCLLLKPERKLGISYLRMMPKESGVRPITNLSRRTNAVKAGYPDFIGAAHRCA
jgi:telomerase reverse transcriptase